MIGLGSQYLTAAGFGRYRITAASLSNLDLLGTLKSWLNGAAKAAILAAFGDDGMAVINATNAYLNGIAASDRDKATALAGLINEDPMMVCSLGLQVEGVTMPIRWLKSDGAFLNTGIKANGNTTLKMQVLYYEAQNGYTCTWGGENSGNTYSMFRSAGENGYFHCNGSNVLIATLNTPWNVEVTPRAFIIEGTSRKTYTQGTHNYPIHIFQIMRNGSTSGYSVQKSQLSFFDILDGDTEVRKLRPFRLGKAWSADKVSTGVAQAKDTLGMIDLVTGIFYPNAASSGAFTMEGEPTPSTP